MSPPDLCLRHRRGLALAILIGLSALLGVSAPARAQETLEDCGLEPPGSEIGPPISKRPNELDRKPAFDPPRVTRAESLVRPTQFGSASPRLRTGALRGKTVYVSAGHGFYWSPVLDRWATQRDNTNDIVEDLVSAETASQFLIPMLLNAGAYVVPLRESDLNTGLVIVDEGDAVAYAEEGPAEVFSTSTAAGFAHPQLPLVTGTNPFELGENRLMESVVGGTPTASATWTPTVPSDGQYNVYISYSQFSYRVPDAHFVVNHAGGQSHFRVNQRRHGSTWVLLGRFFFRAGTNPTKGSVTAFNDSLVQGNISLDAVRLGGGMGMIAGDDQGTPAVVSGRPRFEEASRYHAQFLGAPPAVYDSTSSADNTDDVTTRSRLTAWDHEEGEDAVYVAWHTNACAGTCTARGTDTYVYGPNPPDGKYQFTGVANSDLLAQRVHSELVKDLKSGWEANWRDRGIHSAYFGELNPRHNPETPSILVEVAFHMTPLDATQIKEPQFRYIAARAITQGIIKFFAQKDGTPFKLPPEPPAQVAARNLGDGRVRVAWTPSPVDSADLGGGAAYEYRLYQSEDGYAWDDGILVPGTWKTLQLASDEVRYFRVAAVNAGGESFPSATVGVRVPTNGGLAPILVVNAFDRFDATLGSTEDMTAWGLGSPLRIFVERMNDGSYARRHGAALDAFDAPFDSVTAGSLDEGLASLTPYALVDWFVGRGSANAVQIPEAHQALIRSYVDAGGLLLISGSQIATALTGGSATDRAFLAEVLRTDGAAGMGISSVEGIAGEVFEGLSAILLDDGLKGAYPAGIVDVLTPQAGARSVAHFTGTMDTAAVLASQGATPNVAFLSFPLEVVVSHSHRADLMARILGVLNVPTPGLIPDGGFPDAGGDPDAGEPEDPGAYFDAGVVDAGVDAGSDGGDGQVVSYERLPPTLSGEEAGGCGCTSGTGSIAVLSLALIAALSRRRRSQA